MIAEQGTVIHPDALYDDNALYAALRIPSTTLARARKAGLLRYARQGKRTLYRGTWVLAWLDSVAETLKVR